MQSCSVQLKAVECEHTDWSATVIVTAIEILGLWTHSGLRTLTPDSHLVLFQCCKRLLNHHHLNNSLA